jgi:nucleotide-binding universal stress UspA family protein
MTEKIVVAVDRETAHHAPVAWAMERAVRTGASVELVLIIQRAWSDREPASEACHGVVAAAGLVTVSRGHRLLVIGSRGRHGAQLGSVSHGVILELVSPIIVIGPEGEHHD